MALEEYKRKRNFTATPEPAPDVEKKHAHRFVVQKHHASHLHFDFRLEMEGVLKSWAVPKGPSLDPSDKRLAMQVEDHPVSYFHFEGIIPPGNYGAGTVMVWDTGTWEPISSDASGKTSANHPNPSQMLAEGDLKFRLHGEKLNGDFVLAHMRSRRPGSKGTEWLLIKKKDKFVQEGYDANSDQLNRSVLSGRSMEQIAGDEGSDQWKSSRPAAANGRSRKNQWLEDAITKKDKLTANSDIKDKSKKSEQSTEPASAVKGVTSATSSRRKSPATATSLKKNKATQQTRASLKSHQPLHQF